MWVLLGVQGGLPFIDEGLKGGGAAEKRQIYCSQKGWKGLSPKSEKYKFIYY